jgi:hypothetical protein
MPVRVIPTCFSRRDAFGMVGIYALSWMGPEYPEGMPAAGAFQDDKESVEETLLSEATGFRGGSSHYPSVIK